MTRLALLFAIAIAAFPQGLDWVKANYTKYEYRVPMRDGTKLFTSVFLPKDQSQTWPMMLMRTPYGVAPYGVDQYREQMGANPWLARDKYIFVFQDVRGRYMSGGEFLDMRPHIENKTTNNQFDESSEVFDPKATPDSPRWFCPELAFHRKGSQMAALGDLRCIPELDGMVLLQRGSRLSVQPVTKDQFRVICKLLGKK